MVALDLVHEALESAGIPPTEARAWFPSLPPMVEDLYDPFAEEYPEVLDELLDAFIATVGSGVSPTHLFAALERGLWPTTAERLWRLDRTAEDYRVVSAHLTADTISSLVPTDNVEHRMNMSHERTWSWLGTSIPAGRIAAYVRAGVKQSEAESQHEPALERGEDFKAVETLAALRCDDSFESELLFALE